MGSQPYIVYFLDGPKKGQSLVIPDKVSYFEIGYITSHLDAPPTKLEQPKNIIYHIEQVGELLFAFCEEDGIGFAEIVVKALVQHTSGLFDEATRQLQAINNMLDRDYEIIPDGAIHGDVSEFLEKVRVWNE